jgi:uncharacterized protein involved in exopolysaccharide biosynthesis
MPRLTVLDALQRFWLVLILMTLLGAGAGVLYGLSAEPNYTAEARLSVGRVDVPTQAIPGYATAALTLADAYSRAIISKKVVDPIERKTGLSTSEVLDRVTAAPIPETATVRVFAEAGTASEAVEVVNASARSLVRYVRNLNRDNPDSKRLLEQFNDASKKYGEARSALKREGSSAEAEAKVKTAQLQVSTLGSLYTASQAGQASPNTLQVLALAAGAESDRSSTTQQAVLVGAVIGLMLGALLALGLERRYPIPQRG